MFTLRYRTLARWVEANCSATDTALVGVDGGSASGKSTFAARLADALDDVEIVPMDDFVSWNDLSGWWPRLEEQVLRPLSIGKAARYQRRSWTRDPLGSSLHEWRDIPPRQIIILEGVTSCRRAVADRLTLSVWIDAPAEARLARGIARDGDAMRGHWIEWMQQEEEFFRRDGTRSRTDLRVIGDAVSTNAAGTFVADGGKLLAGLDQTST